MGTHASHSAAPATTPRVGASYHHHSVPMTDAAMARAVDLGLTVEAVCGYKGPARGDAEQLSCCPVCSRILDEHYPEDRCRG